MSISYEVSAPVQALVQQMLESELYTEFRPLREQDIRFTGILKTTTKGRDSNEETVPGAKEIELKKISDLYQVVVESHYLVVFDAYFWQNTESRLRDARLHRALMTVQVADHGKTKKRAPDVVEYRATLLRFGEYSEEVQGFAEVLRNASTSVGHQIARSLAAPISVTVTTIRPRGRGRRARPSEPVPHENTIGEGEEQ